MDRITGTGQPVLLHIVVVFERAKFLLRLEQTTPGIPSTVDRNLKRARAKHFQDTLGPDDPLLLLVVLVLSATRGRVAAATDAVQPSLDRGHQVGCDPVVTVPLEFGREPLAHALRALRVARTRHFMG